MSSRLVPSVLLSSFVVATALACSSQPAQGEFGDAKPTKNDGTIGKPVEAPAPPPDFEHAASVMATFDKASGKLSVALQLQPGFHAYGPGEEVGKPVALSVDAASGWTIDGAVDVPAGTKKDLGALGTSVILEGNVTLGATLKGGTGAVSGVLEAQVCTDKACDRPRKHAFSVPAA